MRFGKAVALALLTLLLPVAAYAQSGTGVIYGVVTDDSGGAVPGASVKATNEDTGVAVDLFSDGAGSYRAEALIPGRYLLEVALDGFETAMHRLTVDLGQVAALDVTLALARFTEGVVVTARRIEETAQEVPIDGVFFARPASAMLDFLDVERIEVLRGPQGTLFGKNTTAGAINVTTRKPSFTPEANVELSYGDLGFVQAKASVTGPLARKVAGRLSFSGTQRDGNIFNVRTQHAVNDLNNLGLRGQILAAPSDTLVLLWTSDYTRQRPQGYTQVVAGVAPTLRPANRQYPQIAADLGYAPPSFNAFDRVTDVDTALRSYQDLGGTALNVDVTTGPGRLTSTTAWRFWNWNPSNDRDFIGLPVTSISAAPSRQQQFTQEVRYAGDLTPRANFVLGGFAFRQTIDSDPSFRQEQGGAAAARFLLAPTAAAATPGLLDGYGYDQYVQFGNVSAAAFGQIEWSLTDRLRLLPGLRFNYDQKEVDFDQRIHGGLPTADPALLALQRSILSPQHYVADVDDTNLSGQLTAAYHFTPSINGYVTYATGFKSVGLNLNGVPTDAADQPVLSAATVKPEDERHIEAGVKTEPFRGVTANATVYDTEIEDFQAQVVNASVGLWSRNLLDKAYFELLSAAPGNTGLYVGQPGDSRSIGVTLRLNYQASRT